MTFLEIEPATPTWGSMKPPASRPTIGEIEVGLGVFAEPPARSLAAKCV
jgi:hypothetical protein